MMVPRRDQEILDENGIVAAMIPKPFHTLPAAAIPVGAIVQELVPYRVKARRFSEPKEGRMVLVDEDDVDHPYGANERLKVSDLPPMPLPKDWGKNDLKPRPRRGGGE